MIFFHDFQSFSYDQLAIRPVTMKDNLLLTTSGDTSWAYSPCCPRNLGSIDEYDRRFGLFEPEFRVNSRTIQPDSPLATISGVFSSDFLFRSKGSMTYFIPMALKGPTNLGLLY
jgi:hypothetical protein